MTYTHSFSLEGVDCGGDKGIQNFSVDVDYVNMNVPNLNTMCRCIISIHIRTISKSPSIPVTLARPLSWSPLPILVSAPLHKPLKVDELATVPPIKPMIQSPSVRDDERGRQVLAPRRN